MLFLAVAIPAYNLDTERGSMWTSTLVHSRKRLLLVVFSIQLVCAYTIRWHLTTATLKSNIEYLLGQEVIASENWHRDGAMTRHFVPSRSIDQSLPEWSYRDDYWRDYLSQPPLSFMMLYWATDLFRAVDPVVVGKLLAQFQIAVGVLVAAGLLYEVFGFAATIAGLSFAIWGQPFLVWFIDGYYSTTPAMVCQLMLVSWCVAFFKRELAGPEPRRRARWRDLLIVGLLAYLGTFSEWVALFGNAIAALAFLVLALCLHFVDSLRAWKAHAVAAAIVVGSAAAEATTVLLYGTRVGFAFYWNGFMSRVIERTGEGGFWPYTHTLIRQMETAWPADMLVVLAAMALVVCGYAAVALAKNGPNARRGDGALLLLAIVLGFGGAATYCYRLKNLVEIHWWFTGTWAIGWMMTICCFSYVLGQILRKFSTQEWSSAGYPVVCAVLAVGAAGWNLSFVNLRERDDRISHDMYRMLGRTLPNDGHPLIVADLPELFEEYPFATAYLRRPVVRYNSSGDPYNQSGDLLLKLGTSEDATPDLLDEYGFPNDFVYIAYDKLKRLCEFNVVSLPQSRGTDALAICRVRTRSLLQNPINVWSTSLSTNAVDIGPAAGTFTVKVSAPRTWMWTAAGNDDFVTLVSQTPITGPGLATFSTSANLGFARRSAVTVAAQPVWVAQEGILGFDRCVSSIGVQDRWRALGGVRSDRASVAARPGCVWAATSSVPWISVPTSSATGDGQLAYTVAPNLDERDRIGHIVAGGKTVEIVELGCPYTISTISVDVTGRGSTVQLSLTGECTWRWTAVSEDAFVRVSSGHSGAGKGVVTLDVTANPGAARTARVKVAGYPVTVRQAGSF
jgi:hypothetical protein